MSFKENTLRKNLSFFSFYLLFFGFVYLNNNKCYSQDKDLKFTHIAHKDGLLHSEVDDLIEDKSGFLWIATQDALSKYDGYTLKHYRNIPGDTLSLSSNRARSIVEDKDGNIWIGTEDGGINKFIRKTEEFERYLNDKNNSSSLISNTARKVYIDRDNILWVGTENGLCKLIQEKSKNKSGKFKTYKNLEEDPSSISSNLITTIFEDNHGNLWIGTKNGLNLFNKKNHTFKRYFYNTSNGLSISNNIINDIFQDKDDRLWIGTNNGLNIYDYINDSFRRVGFNKNRIGNISNSLVHAISQDNTGTIWVGTQKGLNRLIEETENGNFIFKNYFNDPLNDLSISSDIIQCFYPGFSGVFWIGSREGGVSKLDFSNQKFQHFSNSSTGKIKLNEKSIWGFYEDNDGIIWVGARGGGLNKIDLSNNNITYYKSNNSDPQSISNNYVWDILEDNDEKLWIGTFGSGICVMDKKSGKFTSFKDKDHGIHSVLDIHEDRNGRFWVATYGQGLAVFNKKTGTYLPVDLEDIKRVTDIFESKNGDVWFGTDGSGLIRFNNITEKYEVYIQNPTDKNSLINNTVWSICETDNYLWLGTNTGLERLEIKDGKFNFKHYTESYGLVSTLIYSLINDNEGNIWMGTANGLSKFNPNKESFKNYDVKDGIQSNEFNAGAVYKNSRGELYFGGINGFNKFDPKELVNNKLKPRVYITDFKIANKSIKVKSRSSKDEFVLKNPLESLKEIKLNYKQSFFSFDFVAINYKQSDKNQYAYYLEGLENDWNYINSRREANYTNVPPGDYVFKVKASNNDGLWNEEGVSLKIIITPPFWETLWFKFIIAFIVVGGSILYYKMRMASIKKINIRLEQQVVERTAEVVAQKDEIKQQAEELEQQRDYLADANKSISLKNEEISQRFEDIKILSEIGQKVTASVNIDEIIKRVYTNVNKLMDAPNFEIGLIHQNGELINYSGFHNRNEDIFHSSRDLHKPNSLTSYVVKNKELVFIQDTSKEIQNYISDQKTIEKYQDTDIKSLIYLPLYLENKILGVLIVRSHNTEAYTDIHLNILKNLGAYISIALDNAKAYTLIEQKNQHITDSINAALSIQEAILPSKELMDKLLEEYFLVFRPKDIVSGDFYWLNEIDGKIFLGIVDCTGHGVPGAFMSMIGSSLLSKIIKEKGYREPADILEELDKETKSSLKHDDSHSREGMDLGLCVIDKSSNDATILKFAGAKVSMYYTEKEDSHLKLLSGNRRSIGSLGIKENPFVQHELTLLTGAQLYISTDGFIDQNDKSRKRFGTKKFIKLIENITIKSVEMQGESLEKELDSYKGNEPQRDDITVIGLRI